MAVCLRLAGNDRTAPSQSLLNIPHLRQAFFGDGERLDEHGGIAHVSGYWIHKLFVVDDELRHKAMLFFNTPFGEVAGEAEILPARSASHALIVRGGTPYHRHDQI